MNKRAFSLLELLVVSAVFAMVLFSIYSAFRAGLFGFKNIEENLDAAQAIGLAVERVNTDLRNSFAFADDDAMLKGENKALNFFTLTEAYETGIMKHRYADVSYFLDSQNRLMRLSRTNTDAMNVNSGTSAQVMLPGVKTLNFKYYDMASGVLGQAQDSWPLNPAQNKFLPACVKISLEIEDRSFERKIFLPGSKKR